MDVGTFEVLIAAVTLLIAPGTAVVTWRLTRRKTEAEADTTIVQGARTTVDAMQAVMNELRLQVQELHRESEELRRENELLKGQVARLQEIISGWEAGGLESK